MTNNSTFPNTNIDEFHDDDDNLDAKYNDLQIMRVALKLHKHRILIWFFTFMFYWFKY